MSNKKWLTDQLLDIFEKYKQVKNLNPVIIGYSKSGETKYKKSPKFTSTIRLILLAIVKYDQCFMSLQTISNISGVDRRNVQSNIKILAENNIITVTHRMTKSGDPDSNFYTFNLETLLSFFENRKEVGIKHPNLSVDNSIGVGIKHPYGRDESSLGVGIKHPPNKQALINKDKKQRETREERAPLTLDFFPDKKTKAFVFEELGYNKDEAAEILEEFFHEYLDDEEFQFTNPQWQKRLRKWFRRERKKPGFLESCQDVEKEKPKPREYYAQEVQATRSILQMIGKPNGIGKLNDDKNLG